METVKRPGYAPHRSRTGIPGIGLAEVTIHRKRVRHFTANCGRKTWKFNIERLGHDGALRAALKARATYEREKGIAC